MGATDRDRMRQPAAQLPPSPPTFSTSPCPCRRDRRAQRRADPRRHCRDVSRGARTLHRRRASRRGRTLGHDHSRHDRRRRPAGRASGRGPCARQRSRPSDADEQAVIDGIVDAIITLDASWMIGEFIDEILSGDRVVVLLSSVSGSSQGPSGSCSTGSAIRAEAGSSPRASNTTAPEPNASRPVADSEPRTTLLSGPPFAMRTERRVFESPGPHRTKRWQSMPTTSLSGPTHAGRRRRSVSRSGSARSANLGSNHCSAPSTPTRPSSWSRRCLAGAGASAPTP